MHKMKDHYEIDYCNITRRIVYHSISISPKSLGRSGRAAKDYVTIRNTALYLYMHIVSSYTVSLIWTRSLNFVGLNFLLLSASMEALPRQYFSKQPKKYKEDSM